MADWLRHIAQDAQDFLAVADFEGIPAERFFRRVTRFAGRENRLTEVLAAVLERAPGLALCWPMWIVAGFKALTSRYGRCGPCGSCVSFQPEVACRAGPVRDRRPAVVDALVRRAKQKRAPSLGYRVRRKPPSVLLQPAPNRSTACRTMAFGRIL